MKYLRAIALCLLLNMAVLGAQSFGFGSSIAFSADSSTLQGIVFDIPTKGPWNAHVVGMLDVGTSTEFNLGFKINRDMGKVYNIMRYVGVGMGISQDWAKDLRLAGQAQVGIKIPGFVEGFWFDLEVGFSLSANKAGKLRGGAFVSGGTSYSF